MSMHVHPYERLDLIRTGWCKGIRSTAKLAQYAGCDPATVRRDLVYLRKELRHRAKKLVDLDMLRLEEDAALINDIEQINIVIQENKKNSSALVGLLKAKLKARQQRAELWGLVSPGANVAVGVKVEQNSTKINTPHAVIFSAVKDECQSPV